MEGILLENINCNIFSKPFDHSLYKLFSDELCSLIIENFYSIESKMVKNDLLSQSRLIIGLVGKTNSKLNMNCNGVELDKIEPLNTVIQVYIKEILPNLKKKYYDDTKENFKYKINLVFDKKNYEIGPHTDSSTRKATIVTYFVPEKDKGKKLGLSLYKDLINRHKKEWFKTHYSFDNFRKIKEVDYYNGSTIDFKVCKKSFHGVKNIEEDCDRISIQAMIF